MPTVSITLSASATAEVNDAFAALYGYRATIDGQPNPESKAQFTKRKIIEFIKERVITYRKQVALATVNSANVDIT